MGNRLPQPPLRRRPPKRRRGPFADWIARSGLTLTEVADRLGYSLQSVSNLRGGHSRPSLSRALEIERFTGGAVPAESWSHR